MIKNRFATLIDPSAIICDRSVMSSGTIIFPLSVVSSNCVIKRNCIICANVMVGHDDIINEYVTIYPSATISGSCEIGSYCQIGTGAKIIQCLSIASNIFVGAGCVVVNNLKEKATYTGVPARKI